MAAKKTTQASGTEKKNGKGKGGGVLVEDPPVIVGGGSSVNVIFKNTGSPVTPPAGYKKFRLTNNITKLTIYDGINPGTREITVAGTFFVQFD